MYCAQCFLVIALLFGPVYSWDIAVTAEDRIEFYTIDGKKADTVHFKSQNLTALTYDEVHDTLLYVDKQSSNDGDAICGYKISFEEYQCYTERNGRSIQGLAFDPVTEKLFFTDTKERSINWFSFKSGFKNNVYGNLLIKVDEGIPTDIAVDGCRGYVYWINTNLTPSTIERARFDGSDREVVINATHEWDLQSLAIDQQAQKIYWKMPESRSHNFVNSADLNGENRKRIIYQIYFHVDHLNAFSVTKHYLLSVSSCTSCNPRTIYQFPKPLNGQMYKELFEINSKGVVGIVTNYKIKDQFRGISDCSSVPNNYRSNNSTKIAREYKVHTGVGCEASVCDNYCLQGNCSFTEEGLPTCRCNSGYSGERCEVNVCNGYCLNNGACSLNEEDEPVCECIGEYAGGRCEVPAGVYNVDGSVIEKLEQACQTTNSRLVDDQNNTISSASKHYTAERNITLADLLANWQNKPVATISVVVEVKSNN